MQINALAVGHVNNLFRFSCYTEIQQQQSSKARIQIITDRLNDKWLPVFAGEYVPAECMGGPIYMTERNTTM